VLITTLVALTANAWAQDAALVVGDTLPFGNDIVPGILDGSGFPPTVVDADGFTDADLSDYAVIVVRSCQGDEVYGAWNDRLDDVEAWVSEGGFLEIHAINHSSCGATAGALVPEPPGSEPVIDPAVVNQGSRPYPLHPTVAGLPDFTDPGLAYGSFQITGGAGDVWIIESPAGNALFWMRPMGCGMVTVTTMPLEKLHADANVAGLLMQNNFAWSAAFTPNTPGSGVDLDGDTVPESCDLCPDDRLNDSDFDGVCNSDDACRNFDDALDYDKDTVPDQCDNCVEVPNADQLDSDLDGPGDACDACPVDAPDDDDDDDGVCNSDDRCEGFPDSADRDFDGIPNGCDNCIYDENADQFDADGDGRGNVCDPCPLDRPPEDIDGDGLCNYDDPCPTAGPKIDLDYDGVGDPCDNCVDVPNSDQADDDGDGVGNVCDLCPGEANGENQPDLDGDGVPDLCDCNIYDPTAYYGAVEVCDGVDNDCNGIVDDPGTQGELVFYADLDGDGFGDPAVVRTACVQPLNFVTDATDCDDTRGSAYPGAREVCNELDDDCDTEVDEEPTAEEVEAGARELDCGRDTQKVTEEQGGCTTAPSTGGATLALLALLGLGQRRR